MFDFISMEQNLKLSAEISGGDLMVRKTAYRLNEDFIEQESFICPFYFKRLKSTTMRDQGLSIACEDDG